MNLYLITQAGEAEWDTYDSAVVAAPDEDTARGMSPRAGKPIDPEDRWSGWTLPEYVTARLIGVAVAGTEQGVICASFNAG